MRMFWYLSLFSFACSNQIPDDVERPDRSRQDQGVGQGSDSDAADTGVTDDDQVPTVYEDADEDGWPSDVDCDDSDSRIHPAAPEYCDGIDSDCDGIVDPNNAIDAEEWFRDRDRDGFGDPEDSVLSCDQPEGPFVSNGDDCDDSTDRAHPDAEEVCDGIDNDCDGIIDPPHSLNSKGWFRDNDMDGHGSSDWVEFACASPGELWVESDGDCDDSDATVFPGATEWCDGVDSDCDGLESTHIATFEAIDGSISDVTADLVDGHFRATHMGSLRVCEGAWESVISIDVDADSLGIDERTFLIEGIGDVFIDAGGSDRVVTVESGPFRVELVSLVLMGGYASQGGAFYAETADLFLDGVLMMDNVATSEGGAVFLGSGDVTAFQSDWAHNEVNTFGAYGGAISLVEGDFVGDDVVFHNNAAKGIGFGGALFLHEGDLILNDAVLRNNEASLRGGAAMLSSGDVELVDSMIRDNSASTGGGIYMSGQLDMIGSTFESNTAAVDGGGVYMTGVSGESGVECVAAGHDDAGFLGNESDGEGGALWIGSTDSTIRIQSNLCDWGTGSTDNEAFDIGLPHHRVIADGEVTFVCNGAMCSSTVESYGLVSFDPVLF